MTPIETKYQQLGGPGGFLGKLVTHETNTPGAQGSYAEYEHGMIFYNASYGAVVISEAIAQKWLSDSVASTVTRDPNLTVMAYLGFPIKDSATIANTAGEVCYFERGMIVVNSNHIGFVVYDEIYMLYRTENDVNGWMGLPVSDETNAAKGGRVSSFEWANIYWSAATGAHEVTSSILDRYKALDGPGGFLGYPATGMLPVVKENSEIGYYIDFEGGSIYSSKASGAWSVIGSIRLSWLTDHKGTAGELGFPTSNETCSSNDNYRFSNFQHGLLAWQKATGRVRKITKLDFVINSLEGRSIDEFGPGANLYVKEMAVKSSDGFNFKQDWHPRDDKYVDKYYFQGNEGYICSIPVKDGNMKVTISMRGWDKDYTSPDDELGFFTATYTIDNLWEATTTNLYAQTWYVSANNDDKASFKATFNLKPDGDVADPFNPATFRRDLFWYFRNKMIGDDIGTLSKEIFASTFSDVIQDESWWNHPFNTLFFEFYRAILSPGKGVCFGMCLEALYALKGSSSSNEPISNYQLIDDVRKTQIAIKHGYQLGGDQIDYILDKLRDGDTHDPVKVFDESKAAFDRGDFPILSLSNDMYYSKGHAVVPYDWNKEDPMKWIIRVANPNTPYQADHDNNAGNSVIYVYPPPRNAFYYQHLPDTPWQGDASSGGRMVCIPYSQLSSMPRTPFEEVAGLRGIHLLLMGDGGSVSQITDGNDRTFYKPDRQVNTERDKGIPNMMQFNPTPGSGARRIFRYHMTPAPPPATSNTMHCVKLPDQYDKMYVPKVTVIAARPRPGTFQAISTSHFTTMVSSVNFARNITPRNVSDHYPGFVFSSVLNAMKAANARTLKVEILNNDLPEYSWGISSGNLKMHITSQATKDTVDEISIDGVGTPGQALTFKLKETASPKKVKIAVGNFIHSVFTRMIEIPNIALSPGQSVTVQVNNGCKELIMYNTGPDLTFDLKLYTNKKAEPFSVKSGLKIDSNKVAVISPDEWNEVQLPATQVTMNIFDKMGGTNIRQVKY